MATMVACTALELTAEQKQALCKGVERGASEAFHIDVKICELMIMPTLPPENHGVSATGQITYFVYTAPDKTVEQKRQLIKNLYDETVKVTGPLGKSKVVVIIKEHSDENVGVDGVLRADAKRAAQHTTG